MLSKIRANKDTLIQTKRGSVLLLCLVQINVHQSLQHEEKCVLVKEFLFHSSC